MKNKLSFIWRAAFAIVLACSLIMGFSPAQPVSAQPALTVTITPPGGSTVFVCDTFSVVAKVCNGPTADRADDVVVSIKVTGDATLVGGEPNQLVHDICPGSCKEANWTVHCTGAGSADIEVTATPSNGGQVVETVTLVQKCRLGVEITAPADGAQFKISDRFAVTATVTNNTGEMCEEANVCLSIDKNAVLNGGSPCYNVGPIPAGKTQVVNWTVHCTAAGETELKVTATGCGQEGEAAEACADKVKVKQANVCAIELVMDPPPGDKICICQTFNVTGKIINTGNTAISGVQARLTVTEGAANVDQVGCPAGAVLGSWYTFAAGPIDPGATVDVFWCVHCKGRTNPCAYPDWVSFRAEARATCASTTITATPVDLPHYKDQRNLIVKILEPVHCTDFCIGDELLVDVSVQNCFTTTVVGNVSIVVSGPAQLFPPPGTPQNWTISNGQTRKLSDPPGPPVPWHIKCMGPGDVTITVTYLGVAGVATLCDTDTVTIHQKTVPSLGVVVDAPDCAAVCENFDVTATVTNTGDANATKVTNISVSMTTGGDVTEVSAPPSLTIPVLDPGKSKTLTWTYHCDDCEDAAFMVEAVGASICTTEPIGDWDIDYTKQIDLGVEITSPQPCITVHPSETFCVTARISNDDCDDSSVTVSGATISINGNAALVENEQETKNVGAIAKGEYKDISWTVHCNGPGDVDISVEANVTAPSPCDLRFDDSVTIHQESPELTVEILSPAYGTAIVATSQDFAVTAKVCNIGSTIAYNVPVTIDPGTKTTVLPPPDATQTIARLDPGKCETLTWTLHCKEQGVEEITVTAVGLTPVSASVPVLQYPAAHLEVKFTNFPTGTVPTSTVFPVTAVITNTGEADATEVSAVLSVQPEGSVRVAAGEVGFTKSVGTIPGHLSPNNSATVTWNLHCKQACESTLTVTATGADEYGWHQKQQCQTTGNFLIEEGGVFKMAWCEGSGYETINFDLDGKANGLIGPFNLEAYIAFNAADSTCCEGWLSAMGIIDSDGSMEGIALLQDMNECGQGNADCEYSGIINVTDGLFNVVNGLFEGYFNGMYNGRIPISVAITDGTFCSTMASTPGLAIQARFIEPASVTVKQVDSGGLDLGITKTVDNAFPQVGSDIVYTVTVTNNGPTNATGVVVEEPLPVGLTYKSSSATQGSYNSGIGEWAVGGLVAGAKATLKLTATVNATGAITNTVTVSCDQPDGVPGNNSASVTINRAISDVPLSTGWNMMSLPQIPTDGAGNQVTDINTILAGIIGQVTSVWYYDPATGWHTFIPFGPVDLTTMEDGKAYLMNMNAAATLQIANGVNILPPPNVPPAYDVVVGWNMVGFKSTTARPACDYLLACVEKQTRIYGMVNGAYFALQPSANMEPGLGYWISFKEAGTIYP